MILAGCVHQTTTESKISINATQTIPFDQARVDASTAKSPALYKFTKSGHDLWYLAASHGTEVNSDTFKFIHYVLNTQKINIVIVEGFETGLELSPTSITGHILDGKTATFYPNGEPSFVIENALDKHIPFVGGEPSDKDIYNAILQKGFYAQDLLGFNFVRRIPQLKRSQQITNLESLQTQFNSYIKSKLKDFDIKDFNFTFEDFKNWYKINQRKNLSLESGEKGETAPIDGPYLTQKISKVITVIRDEHILKTINELLKKFQNVFIVYGSSHYRVEHLALKNALGMPVEIDIKDVP